MTNHRFIIDKNYYFGFEPALNLLIFFCLLLAGLS